MLLFLDFESRYDTATGFTLKNGAKSIVEYVRSPRFKAFGLSVCTEDGDVTWVTGHHIPTWGQHVAWENTTVVAHNAKFDGFILEEVYGFRPKDYICTQAMARAVLGKTVKSHSLAFLAGHFGLPSKGIMKTDGVEDLTAEQEEALAEYGRHDTWLCRELFNRLNPQFPEGQKPVLSWTIKNFCRPKLTLDVPMLRKAAADEIRKKRRNVRNLQIDGSIFRSQPKFQALLEKEGFVVPMKPSPKKKDAEGKPLLIPALALGDAAFVEMLESDDERLRTLCEARKLAKSSILHTRAKKLATIGETGLFPADIQFSGADQTHRFSGGDGSGGNFQNFVKKSPLRFAVRPMEGHSLVVGDAAQIEARFVAYLSRDPILCDLIENQPDLYC